MSVPVEVVDAYIRGEREIFVSPEVFEAFSDDIMRRGGYLERFPPSPAFNVRPTLAYKDAVVSVARSS